MKQCAKVIATLRGDWRLSGQHTKLGQQERGKRKRGSKRKAKKRSACHVPVKPEENEKKSRKIMDSFPCGIQVK